MAEKVGLWTPLSGVNTDDRNVLLIIMEQIELSSLDVRYEDYRLKWPQSEKALLTSILTSGIRDPLQGVNTSGQRILLDGFKRYRCAKKLGIQIVPFVSICDDEALGIIELIRISNARSLNIVEQARLIEELKTVHRMSTAQIAGHLERSKGWVSMRSGLMKEMSDVVMQQIFTGGFPVYAFMYTLRKFIRMNGICQKEIDEFVQAVSGKKLSIRDIEKLAHGYFKGSNELREQIKSGNLAWILDRLKEKTHDSQCSGQEQSTLKALEILLRYMQRLLVVQHPTMSKEFAAQANLLSGGLIRQLTPFTQALRQLHDRSRQA